MEKISKLIQRVQSLYSKGVHSDDSSLRARHIYHKLTTLRERLIVLKDNKKQKISDWSYQTISCMKMVKVPLHECPCLPPVGCSILRSQVPLPKPLVGLGDHLIRYVASLDGEVVFDYTSFESIKNNKGNRYTKNSGKYFIRNGYIFLVHNTAIRFITVSGVFSDPLAVQDISSMCEENCKDCEDCVPMQEKEFPIDGDLIEPLIELAVEELVSSFNRSRPDQTNDARDTTENG